MNHNLIELSRDNAKIMSVFFAVIGLSEKKKDRFIGRVSLDELFDELEISKRRHKGGSESIVLESIRLLKESGIFSACPSYEGRKKLKLKMLYEYPLSFRENKDKYKTAYIKYSEIQRIKDYLKQDNSVNVSFESVIKVLCWIRSHLPKYHDEDTPRVIAPSYFAITDQLQISDRTLRYAKTVLEDLCLISSETYIYRGSDTEFRKFTCFTYFSDYSHKEIVSYLKNSKYIDYTRCTSDK